MFPKTSSLVCVPTQVLLLDLGRYCGSGGWRWFFLGRLLPMHHGHLFLTVSISTVFSLVVFLKDLRREAVINPDLCLESSCKYCFLSLFFGKVHEFVWRNILEVLGSEVELSLGRWFLLHPRFSGDQSRTSYCFVAADVSFLRLLCVHVLLFLPDPGEHLLRWNVLPCTVHLACSGSWWAGWSYLA